MMEHGFHGFFPQYYNLKSLVDELSISDNFLSLDSYAVVYKGDQYGPEIFRPNHSAFPWNVVDLAIASPNMLNWGLNLTKKAHWEVFREITSFNPQKTYQRLDHLSVADWIKNDFPRGLYDLYFLPFAKSSLNSPDVLSAGELMQFFHFYFFGNPEGLAFEGTKQDMGTSLVQPIANSILAKGGQILTDTTISQVHWHEGKVESLTYQEGNGVSSVPFWVSRNDSLSSPMNHGAPEVPSAPTFYGAGIRYMPPSPTPRKPFPSHVPIKDVPSIKKQMVNSIVPVMVRYLVLKERFCVVQLSGICHGLRSQNGRKRWLRMKFS
jgi:isorenieratene synthase